MRINSNDIKQWMRKSALLVNLKRRASGHFEYSLLDVVSTFSAFVPNSAGGYRTRAAMTVQAVNETTPLLCQLAEVAGKPPLKREDIRDIPTDGGSLNSAISLGKIFEAHGSDKARHDYHYLYGSMLSHPEDIRLIFEIGLGTNNVDVVSTMGTKGTPGASLRAFRDFCPNAAVYGADIDKRILFSEDRISTFFADQTDSATLNELARRLPHQFDLVIDDGLHAPNANIASLIFGLTICRIGGWVVIEDVAPEAIHLWEVVASVLPAEKCDVRIVEAKSTLVIAVRKLAEF